MYMIIGRLHLCSFVMCALLHCNGCNRILSGTSVFKERTFKNETHVTIADPSGELLVGYDIAFGSQFNFEKSFFQRKVTASTISINTNDVIKNTVIRNAHPNQISEEYVNAALSLWFLKDGFEPYGVPYEHLFSENEMSISLKSVKRFNVSLDKIRKNSSNKVEGGLLLCWDINSHAGYQFCQWQEDFNNVSLLIVPKQHYGVILVLFSNDTVDILKSVIFIDEHENVITCQDTKCYLGKPIKNIALSKPDLIKVSRINPTTGGTIFLPPNNLYDNDFWFAKTKIKQHIGHSTLHDVLYFCDPSDEYCILILSDTGSTITIAPETSVLRQDKPVGKEEEM